MALYHFHVSPCSRGKGQSVASAAAYINGIRLVDAFTGKTSDFSQRSDVAWHRLYHPPDVPHRLYDRQQFYNELNQAEPRKDSQLARVFNLSLPVELSREQQIELIDRFVTEELVNRGYSADVALHTGEGKPGQKMPGLEPVWERENNPHIHIISPFRKVDANGLQPTKTVSRSDNNKNFLLDLRRAWAEQQNRAYQRAGLDLSVSHKSLKEREIDRLPTPHLGPRALAAERNGIRTARGDRYRSVVAHNRSRARTRSRDRSQDQQPVRYA